MKEVKNTKANNESRYVFSNETLTSIDELCNVLKKIHDRLALEGYTIVNGQIKKLDTIKF